MQERQKQAWALREAGKPNESIAILNQLAFELFAEEDYKNAVDILVDMSIAYKQTSPATSYSILLSSEKILENNNLEIRADLDYYIGTAAIASENYQEGISRLNKFLESDFELSDDRRAYVESKIGFAKFNLGDERGEELVRNSLQILENSENAVWRTGVKLSLAEVTQDPEESKNLINEVIKESREENLGARLAQAEKMLEI